MSLYGSPIEERFAAALERTPHYVNEGRNGDLTITPQAPIGPFRVDFLLTDFAPETYSGFKRDITVHLVVECDGHDFHDRTKEQAARDRERDQMLLRAGYPVIRFTGSQIHADADRCAEDTFDTMTALFRLQAWGDGLNPSPI